MSGAPAGQSPTSGRPAAGVREFVVATVGGGKVEIMSGVVERDPDPLLTSAEVGKALGITAGSWRSLVNQGIGPVADEPGEGPVNRRTPRWRLSTVEHYVRTRKSASWKRKEAAGGGNE